MTIEARIAALNIASSIHKETTAIVEAAKHFAAFLIGDGTEAPKTATRGRKAAGEAEGKAQTVTEVAATAQSAPAAAAGAVTSPATVVTQPTTASEPKVVTQKTLQQVADAIIALANSPTGGRDKAVAILAKYNVKKVPELKPETFDAVLADVAAANAPVLESLV